MEEMSQIPYLLLEIIVKSRRPLPAPESCGRRAVVHHKGHASCVHVRVQRVDRLDHRLVANLAVAMALAPEHLNLRHHRRADACKRVELSLNERH